MKHLKEQLIRDAKLNIFRKDDLLHACLNIMTDDQLFEMAIVNRFILVEDVEDVPNTALTGSAQERIIDAVLARHGD